MVSDFITEYDGYLALDEEYRRTVQLNPAIFKAARVLFKYGAHVEGYWNSEKFLTQVEKALEIAAIKYPIESHTVVFIFD